MKSAMPGLPSFIDYAKLRWKSNLANTLMNSLALEAIPNIRWAALSNDTTQAPIPPQRQARE
jgi:hypothetical protein